MPVQILGNKCNKLFSTVHMLVFIGFLPAPALTLPHSLSLPLSVGCFINELGKINFNVCMCISLPQSLPTTLPYPLPPPFTHVLLSRFATLSQLSSWHLSFIICLAVCQAFWSLVVVAQLRVKEGGGGSWFGVTVFGRVVGVTSFLCASHILTL